MRAAKTSNSRKASDVWVPAGWSAARLGTIASVRKGKRIAEKGVPCIELEHVEPESGRLFGWDDSGTQASVKTTFSKGDVLFGKLRPYLRKYAVAPFDGICTTEILAIHSIRETSDGRFLFYLMQGDGVFSTIETLSYGTKMPRVSWADLSDIEVRIPPLPEQQKIAAILTTVDDKLDVIARQIEATQTLKRGLMQRLFSRGAGTPDSDGRLVAHTEFKESELGIIPKEWTVAEILSIADVIRGASPRPQGDPRYYGGSVPRLMGADVTRDGKYVTPQIDFLTEEGAKRSRPCPKGTLTIICSGDVGIPSFLAVDACIHDGFLALVNIDESKASKNFLYHIIFSLKQKFDASATHGGVFTNLTTEILKKFLLPLPPLDEQVRIASVLDAADEKLTIARKKMAFYQAMKRGLMQKLLTGEWRVKLEDVEPLAV
jgi:type I restriction enzyme S subunit